MPKNHIRLQNVKNRKHLNQRKFGTKKGHPAFGNSLFDRCGQLECFILNKVFCFREIKPRILKLSIQNTGILVLFFLCAAEKKDYNRLVSVGLVGFDCRSTSVSAQPPYTRLVLHIILVRNSTRVLQLTITWDPGQDEILDWHQCGRLQCFQEPDGGIPELYSPESFGHLPLEEKI